VGKARVHSAARAGARSGLFQPSPSISQQQTHSMRASRAARWPHNRDSTPRPLVALVNLHTATLFHVCTAMLASPMIHTPYTPTYVLRLSLSLRLPVHLAICVDNCPHRHRLGPQLKPPPSTSHFCPPVSLYRALSCPYLFHLFLNTGDVALVTWPRLPRRMAAPPLSSKRRGMQVVLQQASVSASFVFVQT